MQNGLCERCSFYIARRWHSYSHVASRAGWAGWRAWIIYGIECVHRGYMGRDGKVRGGQAMYTMYSLLSCTSTKILLHLHRYFPLFVPPAITLKLVLNIFSRKVVLNKSASEIRSLAELPQSSNDFMIPALSLSALAIYETCCILSPS
jgi:hypothetical protein